MGKLSTSSPSSRLWYRTLTGRTLTGTSAGVFEEVLTSSLFRQDTRFMEFSIHKLDDITFS